MKRFAVTIGGQPEILGNDFLKTVVFGVGAQTRRTSKPFVIVAGTRITVESILERLAAGETKEHILAALLFTLTGLLRSRA
jgi:hypothetical protein